MDRPLKRNSNTTSIELKFLSHLAVLVCLIAVLAGSRYAWLRLNNSAAVKFRFADRSYLYPGVIKVSKAFRDGSDKLVLVLENALARELIVSNPIGQTQLLKPDTQGRYKILLQPGESKVQIAHTDDSLVVRYDPPKDMWERGYKQARKDGYVYITKSSLEIWANDRTRVEDWKYIKGSQPLPSSITAVVQTRSPQDLLVAYDRWVQGKKGIPLDKTQDASPELTLCDLDSGISKGWCNNLSKGFLPVARAANLVARQVGSHDLRLKDVWLGNHQMNEWFDSALQKWRVVDFTLDILEVSQEGKFLDADEFSRVIKAGGHQALLFKVLDPQNLEPHLCVWSGLSTKTRDSISDYYGKGQRSSYALPKGPPEPKTVLVEDTQFVTVDKFELRNWMKGIAIASGAAILLVIGSLIWRMVRVQTRAKE